MKNTLQLAALPAATDGKAGQTPATVTATLNTASCASTAASAQPATRTVHAHPSRVGGDKVPFTQRRVQSGAMGARSGRASARVRTPLASVDREHLAHPDWAENEWDEGAPAGPSYEVLWASIPLRFGDERQGGRCVGVRRNLRSNRVEVGVTVLSGQDARKCSWMDLHLAQQLPGFKAWLANSNWSQVRPL